MSNNLGESRTELLTWLNDLLKLNYKKIEECGTGAAYCQIMDSIYGDVAMHRVKFNATAEYEFHTNYKILQSCFAKHGVEKTVYVERLVKCRFQDNLEFLQWIKKYWVQNKDSSPYDPETRRKYRQVSTGSSTPSAGSISVSKRKSSVNTPTYSTGRSSFSGSNPNRRVSNEQVLAIQAEFSQAQNNIKVMDKEINTYKETTNILERERDFYFSKLRDIEILVQSTQDLIKEGVYESAGTGELDKFLGKVQQILYATEDNNNGEDNVNGETVTNSQNEAIASTVSDMEQDGNGFTGELSIPMQAATNGNNNVSNEEFNQRTETNAQNLIIDDETF